MQPFRYLLFPLVASALLTTACSKPGNSVSGHQFTVFLDLSGSVDSGQRARWLGDASRVVRSVGDNSSVGVYALHDHTLDAAPLFEAEIPVANPDGTEKVLADLQKARRFARKGALSAVSLALKTGGNAPRTDVFSAIDRIRVAGSNRRPVIVFFSDMLNSTPDFNMEIAGTLTRDSIPRRIQQIATKHSWQPGQLAGAEVYCVLNSLDSGRRAPATDRLIQRDFYRALFQALGATLVSYDTTIPAGLTGSVQGGPYVAQAQ